MGASEKITLTIASGGKGLPATEVQVDPKQLYGGSPVVMGTDRNGRPVKLTLVPDDVHVSEEIATYAAGYKPYPFRADEIAEVVLVDNDFDKYRTMDSSNVFEFVDMSSSINGQPNFLDPASSLAEYRVKYYSGAVTINPVTERNERKAYRSRQAAVKMIQDKMMLHREIRIVNLASTLGNWATLQRKTLGAGFEWNGGPDSDPVKDCQDRKLESDQPGNEFWLNPTTAGYFQRHPTTRDQMRQWYGDATPPKATIDDDFMIPGVGQFRVIQSRKRNLTTGKNDFIWPDGVISLVVHTPGMPADMESIASMKTFRTKGPAGVGYTTREYRMEGFAPEGLNVIAVWSAEIEKMTGSNCGGIITGAVA